MVTPEDIRFLIASGEGYNAEFKVSVPAKVKELSEEVCAFANAAGLTNPVYTTDGMFTVIFPRIHKKTEKSSGKSSERILLLMADNPIITIPEIAKIIKKSTRAVEKQISVLKMDKKLRRNGSLRSGSWEVLSKE